MKQESKKIDALLVKLKGPQPYNPTDLNEIPLGLLSIATFCKKAGFHVLVLNDKNITLDLLQKIVRLDKIDVIGFQCDAENVWEIMSVIKILKKSVDSLLCVAGGPQVTAIPWDERFLKESNCDFVVRSDGEEAFCKILKNKHFGTPTLDSIENITYIKNEKTVRNQVKKLKFSNHPIPERNLTYFPSPPTGLEAIFTSRGCPYHCAFCFEGTQTSEYRTRGVDDIIDEVEILLKERNLRNLAIVDDIFMVSAKRVKAICQSFKKLQKKYHHFSWYCEGRANIIKKNPEIISAMIEAGLVRLQIGIESGDQFVLDCYNKGLSLEDIRTTVKECYKRGLYSIVGNFIIGGPFESWTTINKSISFANELLEIAPGCMDISSSMYTPYPGTAIVNSPKKYGIEILDADSLTGRGDNYAFVRTEKLSKVDLLEAYKKFKKEINEKAISLIPKISDTQMKKIFSCFSKFGLYTMWFSLISKHYQNYYNFFGLQVTRDMVAFQNIPKERIEEYKPFRTIDIEKIFDEKILLDVNHKHFQLSKLSTKIFELCSGKHSIGHIIDMLINEKERKEDREVLKSYVLLTLKNLNEEKIVVFSIV